jgi:hypothetical protein
MGPSGLDLILFPIFAANPCKQLFTRHDSCAIFTWGKIGQQAPVLVPASTVVSGTPLNPIA